MGARDVLAKKKSERNLTAGKTRTAAQGLTLGFADEIEAGLRNPGLLLGLDSSKQEYARDVANAREAVSNYREDYPGRSAALEMGGALLPLAGSYAASLLTGGGAAPAAATTTANVSRLASKIPQVVRNMGKGGAIGGAEGMAYGVGTQEGDLSQRSFLNRDAKTGAGIGFLMPAGLRGLGALNNARRNPLTRAERAFEGLMGNEMGGADITDMFQARNLDKPEMAADLNDSMQRRLGALEGMTGSQGKVIGNQLAERTARQGERIVDDLTETTGVPLNNTDAYAAKVMAERRANAGPLYEAAYEAGEVIDDAPINEMLRSDDMRSAYNDGLRIYNSQNSARALRGEPRLPELPDFPDFAKGEPAFLGLRELDNIYRGMRTQSDTAFRAGDSALGKALKDEAEALKDRLDKLVPEYGQARAVYRSDSEALESLADGRNFWKKGNISARTLKDDMKDLDPASQILYRAGAIDQLRLDIRATEKVDGKGYVDAANKFFSRGDQRDRTRLLFPDGAEGDQAFAAFENRLRQENQMMDTMGRTKGSRTTPLGEEVRAQLDDERFFSWDTNKSLSGNIIDKALNPVRSRVMGGNSNTRRELADLLLDPVGLKPPRVGPANLSPRMRQLNDNLLKRNQQAQQLTGLLNSRAAAMTAGTTGLLGAINNREQSR